MLVTGSSPTVIDIAISKLSTQFSLKNLGEVKCFLGVEVTQTSNGLHLSQAGHIKELLQKVKMQEAKGCPTPMISNSKLSKTDGSPFQDGKLYRSTVGALQYATITRPEISFSVNKVSQYMANPLDEHWKAVKRILRYLAGSTDYGLHICSSNRDLVGFLDSDWAADIDDRRSITRYCVYFGSNIISWCSKKQSVVSRSSTETEYISLAHVVSEMSWILSFLGELKISCSNTSIMWVDNISTISLASNPVLHVRTKHIELDIHFVRDKVQAKITELQHVPSAYQIADILTKPLGNQFFSKLRNKLGVTSLSSLELRGSVNQSSISLSSDSTNDKIDQDHALDGMCQAARDQENVNVLSSSGPPRSWKDVLLSDSKT